LSIGQDTRDFNVCQELLLFFSRNIKITLDNRNRFAVIIGMRHERKAEKENGMRTREPWEMTRDEFRYSENKPKYDGIVTAIIAGRPAIVATYYRATKIAKPEHIRITDSGTIQIPQGRQWVALTDEQIDGIATRAGVEVPSFENKVYHHVVVEKAFNDGKSMPAEVLRDYPELTANS
jgi:hypothetical protein